MKIRTHRKEIEIKPHRILRIDGKDYLFYQKNDSGVGPDEEMVELTTQEKMGYTYYPTPDCTHEDWILKGVIGKEEIPKSVLIDCYLYTVEEPLLKIEDLPEVLCIGASSLYFPITDKYQSSRISTHTLLASNIPEEFKIKNLHDILDAFLHKMQEMKGKNP